MPYDLIFSSHNASGERQRVHITDCEFKDLEIAIRKFKENGFRDGDQYYGCVHIVETAALRTKEEPQENDRRRVVHFTHRK